MKSENRWRMPLAIFFFLYLIALTTLVLFKYGFETGHGSLNFIPFQWIMYPSGMAFGNVFGNIAFFVPFGIFLPLLFKKMTTGKTILAGFLLSLFYEVIQYITDTGGADIDDLILNTLGVVCGALLYLLLKRFAKNDPQLRRNGLIFIIVFGVIASAIFLFV